MINIILSGCMGKMGRVVTRIVSEDEDCSIVAGVDINTAENEEYKIYASPSDIEEKGDVIIDFSHPDCLEGILNYAVDKKIPAVICTTGLSQAQKGMILEASKKVPVFFSANMSVGVNLIIELACRAAKLLEGSFDIEIIEKHHNQKIDAPSGTALAIADAISETLTNPSEYTYDRHSVRKKRSDAEIGIHAVRGGTIVGEHTVMFAGCDEIIEINHSARSKEIFAVGAVKAAKFIVSKDSGLYDMKQLVNSIC